MLTLARDAGPAAASDAGRKRPPAIAAMAVASDPGAIEAEWRAFEAGAAGHVFQAFDFLTPWLAHVGSARGVAPRIVVGRNADGAVLFLLPLGIRPCMGARMLEWLGDEHADYHCGLYDPQFLASLAASTGAGEAFVRAVTGLFAGAADLVHFQRQPDRIDGIANPFAAWRSRLYSAQSHLTRLGTDWEGYYRAKRNSASRRHDRLKWQKMEAIGRTRALDAGSAMEIRRVLHVLVEQKTRSLAARGARDFFAGRGVRDFYEAIALNPHPRGLSHVAAIECDGAIVATNWGLVRGGRYYYVMTSYADGEVSRSSPGRALMHHLMQWSIARGIADFDFTIGDEDFKTQWCEEQGTLHDSIALLALRGAHVAGLLHATKALKRAIKTRPRLKAFVDQIRRRLPAGT